VCYIGVEAHARVLFFFILHEHGSHFWLTNNLFWLLLVVQNVVHLTNSAVFSIRIVFPRSAV